VLPISPTRALLSTVAVAVIAAGPAHAVAPTKPCWERVLADWTNGALERSYAAACYADALKRLPPDVRLYSDADQDIRRAMLAALRKGPGGGAAGGGPPGAQVAAATPAAAHDRRLPLPVLFALTLALTLAAAGLASWVRSRRVAARRAKPLRG
jgi:hypothetical protein